jgi:hypothetical protein
MPSAQKPKKTKRPDKRPARARYWATKTLRKRKVRNLVRHGHMERFAAEAHWDNARKGRVPDGYRLLLKPAAPATAEE